MWARASMGVLGGGRCGQAQRVKRISVDFSCGVEQGELSAPFPKAVSWKKQMVKPIIAARPLKASAALLNPYFTEPRYLLSESYTGSSIVSSRMGSLYRPPSWARSVARVRASAGRTASGDS